MRTFLQSWLPVAAWASLIFFLSTSRFGGAETSHIIVPVLHWLLPNQPKETLDMLHEFIRKSIHFVNYFVLGLLLYRALRGQKKGWALRWALLAALMASTYAATDEYHQSFEAGRGPSAMDALLDTAGASAAQLALWALLRPRQQRDLIENARG